MSRPSVLVVGLTPQLAYNCSACLGLSGYAVHVMGPWSWHPYQLSRLWRRFQRIDRGLMESTGPDLAAYVQDYCCTHGIEVVVPADVTASLSLLHHADRLQRARLFPTPTHAQFVQMHDKWLFSQLADACNVAHPITRLLESPADVMELDLAYPLIVKPPAETGSRGVFVVRDAETLADHVGRCQQRNQMPQLAQELIQGYDLDLTILADHGDVIAWTIQKRDIEHSAMEFIVDDRMLTPGRELVRQSQYHGVIDFDLRYDTEHDRPVIIEANPRFPGSLMFKLWGGVNFPEMGVKLAMGENPRTLFTPAQGRCENYGISPKRLAKALLQGRTVPADMNGYTRNAWISHVRDPLPHLLNWARDRWQKPQHRKDWHLAAELSEN